MFVCQDEPEMNKVPLTCCAPTLVRQWNKNTMMIDFKADASLCTFICTFHSCHPYQSQISGISFKLISMNSAVSKELQARMNEKAPWCVPLIKQGYINDSNLEIVLLSSVFYHQVRDHLNSSLFIKTWSTYTNVLWGKKDICPCFDRLVPVNNSQYAASPSLGTKIEIIFKG